MFEGSTPGQEHRLPLNVCSTSVQSENMQHYFLDFLMEHRDLLRLVKLTPSSMDGMAAIQNAFEDNFRCRGLAPPLPEIEKIFQQFKPSIGSSVCRCERDSRKTQETKVNCPFQFCSSPFTRFSGLKSKWELLHFRDLTVLTIFMGQTTSLPTLD